MRAGNRSLTVAALFLACATSVNAEKRIALIVDTSGSMAHDPQRGGRGNDESRYAVQIAKILTDLAEDEDKIAILRLPPVSFLSLEDQIRIRMPGFRQNCTAGRDPRIMITLQGSDRASFKDQIDRMLQYDGPTFFAAPIHTAIPFLGTDPKVQRLLLFVADAGGFEDCTAQLTSELQAFHNTGAMLALINIGEIDPRGGFSNNPAFEFVKQVDNSSKVIAAVAQVYQAFLGSRNVQTGSMTREISVTVDPHVKEAFLVVAADGPMGDLRAVGGNPHADKVDLDYRGGGQTTGLDRQLRGYRIVRLTNPTAGRYTFISPVPAGGGWMLIQDYSIALRLVTQSVPSGATSKVEFEVVDERTGQRITEPAVLNDLRIEGKIGDEPFTATGGSGSFTIDHAFPSPGKVPVQVRLRGKSVDRASSFSIDVTAQPVSTLVSETPASVKQGEPSVLKVRVVGKATPPEKIIATLDNGQRFELAKNGDGTWSVPWTPDAPGMRKVHFEASGGGRVQPLDIEIAVAAPPPPPPLPTAEELSLGSASAADLGKVKSNSETQSNVQLNNGRVAKTAEIEVSTDFEKRRVKLEIQTPEGWRELSRTPVKVRVASGDPLRWPVRVHTGACPEVCGANEAHHVTFLAHRAGGADEKVEAPLRVEVLPDPWYTCWWREIAIGVGIVLAAIVAYGFISPYRFGRRAGIQMSPEQDLEQGFFYPFRSARGSGAGFYRDAHLYLSDDFRITSKKRGAFARLRAFRSSVRIRPEHGSQVWVQRADGEWESLPQQEGAIRPGVLYRNDRKSIFFEVRMK